MGTFTAHDNPSTKYHIFPSLEHYLRNKTSTSGKEVRGALSHVFLLWMSVCKSRVENWQTRWQTLLDNIEDYNRGYNKKCPQNKVHLCTKPKNFCFLFSKIVAL